MMAVKWFAMGISATLAVISLTMMIVQGEISAETWGLLLLTPVPAGFALTRDRDDSNVNIGAVHDWAVEPDESEDGGIGDPAEAGFDIPIL